MSRHPLAVVLIAIAFVACGGVAVLSLHQVSAGPRSAEHENEQIVYIGATRCGVERWSIKTGIDRDARLANLNAMVHTSIHALRRLHPPNILSPVRRVRPTETTVFRISPTLLRYKIENDSDIHLVVADRRGRTMIAEIPAPPCVGSRSPWISEIRSVRRSFISRFHPTDNWIQHSAHVTLVGVGFFDVPHGQEGVAPNAIELHPVLHISYGLDSPPPTQLSTPIPATPGGGIAVTASVANPLPPQKTTETVTGQITVSGAGVAGVPMDATWHYKSKDVTCSGTSDASGSASCSRDIGTAGIGFAVKIDVRFAYQGYGYTATTSFTPVKP